MTNRHRAIKQQLDWLVGVGIITDWQKSSPDGARWSLSRPGALSITLTTMEVEAWISGALTAYAINPVQVVQ